MEIIRIAIFLVDKKFQNALSVALARESYTMNFFSVDNLDEDENWDLIITDEEYNHKNYIQLVNNISEDNVFDTENFKIFRYKDSRQIVSDILYIYYQITGIVVEFGEASQCKILVAAETEGGSGCTSSALSLASMIYKEYGRRCLYINISPIDDSKKYLDYEDGKNLLKLFYYLVSKKNFSMDIFIKKGENFDYLATSLVNSHFNELKPDILKSFIKKIQSLGLYDFVIFDIGNHFSKVSISLIENAQLVLLFNKEKETMHENYFNLIEKEYEKNIKKGQCIKILTFADDENLEELNIISKDFKAFENYHPDKVSLNNNYGMEIVELCKQVVEGCDESRI